MTDRRALEFVELVLPTCTHTYGVSPCAAAVGTTGEFKCYNSPATCQSHANYAAGEQVVRWAMPTLDLPVDYDYIPSLINVAVRAQKINPGESLGTRESISASFSNHPHNDVGFDKYVTGRGFNPWNQGTFWGKFAARWPTIEGYELRYVRGEVGQAIADMQRRYYIVDTTAGPDNSGHFSITGKDAIKFLDGDKAVAPRPSSGTLAADITDTATTLSLLPSGVGDLEYPLSGVASMGDEKVTFTRSGDAITLTDRALSNSKKGEHKEGETFQLALVFDGIEPSQIIYNLLANYTDTPSAYLDLTAWQAETESHIGRLYSGEIMKPTSLKKLIDELIQQVGLVFYTDTIAKKIRVKALRNLVPVLSVSDDFMLAGSITAKFDSDKRISQVMTFYAQKNPLENIDLEKNYNAILNSIYADPVAALESSPLAIKKIFSRWISIFNRPAAVAINNFLLRRYGRAPRSVAMKLPPQVRVELGSVFMVQSRQFEDAQGYTAAPVTFQAVSVEPTDTGATVLGEEIFAEVQAPDDGVAIVNIDSDSYNLNLREIYNTLYLPPTSGNQVHFVLADGIVLGSISALQKSLTVGDWPAGVIIKLMGAATVAGAGGMAGNTAGGAGGTAIYTRFPLVIAPNVKIWGGGGGGAGGQLGSDSSTHVRGGQGAGRNGYSLEFGEAGRGVSGGPPGGDGGDAGQAGDNYAGSSSYYTGGAAGAAIDGVSFITFENLSATDVRGPQIN